MFRGKTARTVLSLLAAALLAVQFFAPAATFAAAHTLSHVEAKAQSGPKSSAKAGRDGSYTSYTLRDHGRCGAPTGPPQTADRHRSATAGCADERQHSARHTEAIRTSVPPTARHHRTSRASRAHSPATLQVFRC
ncbi:hypothetical protein [Streptomyces fuscichromogenes]|uniref:Secreted protein n=1 Tax=Streptomyces fuscichromogenes TaxID=1324013 RepID=A0A917XAD5_9ACTN|nr:hypothetical protein [Streptomyces fuscichromogenes]GGN01192.1 hypothetical protein GCM10011578_023150 [Streptomyces fuscichromogenes]